MTTFKIVFKKQQKQLNLIGNKIANRITNVPKPLTQIYSKAINEHDDEMPKKRYISPEERWEIIDELRTM